MQIGIIDADLVGRKHHNFPNLACMKISGYYKKRNHTVELIGYDQIDPYNLFLEQFDKVYVSKVFTDTYFPEHIKDLKNVKIGGTGFFFDKDPPLPDIVEHHYPDYHLYDKWVKKRIDAGEKKESYFKYYFDFSIGYTTRGCFRQCEFCVLRKKKTILKHAPVEEFLDKDKPYICLLDDNVLGFGKWDDIIKTRQKTEKPFQYKQGMDIRTMTDRKAKMLIESKYIGNYIFAFDNIKDQEIIEQKLKLWNKYSKRSNPSAVLYCFCAYDYNNEYDENFWTQDIINLLERIKILIKHKSRPFVMRYFKWKKAPFPYQEMYIYITSWANGGRAFQKMSLKQFIGSKISFIEFEKRHPKIAKKYYDMRFVI